MAEGHDAERRVGNESAEEPEGGYRAVCFDMDGVLLDSEAHWHQFEESELLPRVVPDHEIDADAVAGIPYREIYDHLAEVYDVAVSKETFVDLYDSAAAEIYEERAALLPVFDELCGALRDRGVAVGLVTSSPRHWLDVVVERFDLGDAFDVVVSADDLSNPGKPDPAIYEHAADRLGVPPAGMVAIEDSANGLRSAYDAGATVVAFRFEGTPGDGPAHHVGETPTALRDTVLAVVDG